MSKGAAHDSKKERKQVRNSISLQGGTNIFEAMKEEHENPNSNQTEKIIGLLKERHEMTGNLLRWSADLKEGEGKRGTESGRRKEEVPKPLWFQDFSNISGYQGVFNEKR